MGTRHFECRTFDLSDNSPYYSSVILAPEECKKNTQERYEIVKSEPAQSPVRRTFSADETAGASKDFECSSLQPLRYASVYKYSLLGTNHMISSAAPSTTRTTLRVYFRPVFFPEICSKFRWRENRRDGKKYSILRFSVLRNIKENQGDEIPSFCRNFESGPL